jgi:hypothetical protein
MWPIFWAAVEPVKDRRNQGTAIRRCGGYEAGQAVSFEYSLFVASNPDRSLAAWFDAAFDSATN